MAAPYPLALGFVVDAAVPDGVDTADVAAEVVGVLTVTKLKHTLHVELFFFPACTQPNKSLNNQMETTSNHQPIIN